MFRRLGALLAVTCLTLLPAAGAAAGTPARYGAGWLLGLLDDEGFVPGPDGTPDYGMTVSVGLALASAGVGEEAFDAIVANLSADVDAYVRSAGGDRPGALGRLAMLFHTAGVDNTALLARILATDTGPDAALFADPGYHGLFNHALGLLGLATGDGYTEEQLADIEEALGLLVDQQCPNGGWQNAPRAAGAPCGTSFAGPDTNTTSLVVQALVAFDVEPEIDPLTYFSAAHDAENGYGYLAGDPTDANSTAYAVQAITALRGNRVIPATVLQALQLDCRYEEADRGAWAYQRESDGSLEANGFATVDAVPAAAGATFPLDVAEFTAGDATMPCPSPGRTIVDPAPPVPRPAPSRPAPPAPAPAPTLPATGGGRAPWDAKGLAVFGGGILGYGVLALLGARLAERR